MAVRHVDRRSVESESFLAKQKAVESLTRAVLADLALLLIALLVLHLSINGPVPSGGDGGNWLALAREMMGETVMSADVAYEPMFIGLVAAFTSVLDPLGALVFGAFIAEAAVVAAVYLTVRSAGRAQALVSAAIVLFLGYRLEAVAWGAYPQMLGIGAGLVALWALAAYVDGRSKRFLVAALAGGLLTLLTHKLVGALLLAAAPAAAVHLFWQSRWDRTVLKRSLVGVGALAMLGAGFAWSWWDGASAGVEPSLNPLGLTLAEQMQRAFQGSAVPWVVVGALVVVGVGVRSWNRAEGIVVAAGFGWLAASTVAFLASGEPRALIQGQVAVVPIAVIVGRHAISRARRGGRWERVAPVLAGVVLAAVAGSLAVTGTAHYEQSADWYRVAGLTQLRALDGLGAVANEGDLVVASRGPNGNPIGWWVEGYAGLPTYTSLDLGYLAFPDERSQSLAAASVFEAAPADAAWMVGDLGARFLILDRRGPDAGWLKAGAPDGLDVVSDGTLLILEVSDGS